MKVEVRQFTPEVRAVEGEPRRIVGRPIVFNSLSHDLGGFREIVAPGSITFTEDLRADLGHDSKYILGTRSRGTLNVTEDAEGVVMEAILPDTQWARDLAVSMDRGDIGEGSFAFTVLPGGQEFKRENGSVIRTLTKILVSRLTVTSNPAYPATETQVRSAAEVAAEIPTEQDPTAGQAAPPADSGAVDIDHLRRYADMVARG